MDDVAANLDELTDLVLRHLVQRRGLSVTATATLARLAHDGPHRLTALATAEGVAQPSMSRLVQRLERQGFVTRVGDPADGRASLVALTETGRDLLAERRRHRHDRLAGLIAALPEADAASLRLAVHVALPVVRRLAALAEEPGG